MVWWQFLLFPFSVLFDLLTRFRNYLYDSELLKAFEFETNLIAIGNLSMGGSGKTPFTIYLIDFLTEQGFKISTLSRGYRRKSKGFQLANETSNARIIGDEPFQYYLRYQNQVGVAVGEDRVLSIPDLLSFRPETEIILLDDAYQQRPLKFSLSILLTRFDRPFWDDFVFPSGTLRENRGEAKRADLIIVTGCPSSLTESDQVKIRENAKAYSSAKVFFTHTSYLEPVSFSGDGLKSKAVVISGIANPGPFEEYLKRNFNVVLTHRFADHHAYSTEDIRSIIRELDSDTSLITTEKDYVKLREFRELSSYSCLYLPIVTQFLRDEALFQSIVLDHIKDYSQNTN